MKTSLTTLIICIITALCFAKDYKKEFSHSFDVKEGATIILENGDGNVEILSWEKDEISVAVVYHASSKYAGDKDNNNFDVEFSQKGDDVYIIGHEYRAKMNGFFSFQYIKYDYKIYTPAYTNIEIKSEDGDINIQNISGEIDCRLGDGSIYMTDIINNRSRISTQDGNIKIEKHKGDLNIKGDDGNVTIKNAVAKQIDISLKDGRIKIKDSSADFYVDSDDGGISLLNVSGNTLEARSKDGDVDIVFDGKGAVDIIVSTDDGSVDIELKNPVSAMFNIETGDGSIRFDVDDSNIITEKEHYLRGEFGNGEGKIKVRTNDGSIFLSSKF